VTQVAARSTAAFLVGLAGWLITGWLRVDGWWMLAMAFALGVTAALAAKRPIYLIAFWLGMLAAYPAALALGVFAFLGEGWELVVFAVLLAGGAGYGAFLILRRRGSLALPVPRT